MNQINVLTAMSIFSHYLMEDASENEIRLTLFALTLLSGTSQNKGFLLKSEVLVGFERFDETGKRVQRTLGAGIDRKDLTKAIEEVNERRLLHIEVKSSETLLVKLNLKYLKDASQTLYL